MTLYVAYLTMRWIMFTSYGLNRLLGSYKSTSAS